MKITSPELGMHIFITLLFVFVPIYSMKSAFGKRKNQELESATKFICTNFDSDYSLGSSADDVKRLILSYVLAANNKDAAAKVNYTVKNNHACFRINKKFNNICKEVSAQFFCELASKYPQEFGNLIDQAAMSPERIRYLKRLVSADVTNFTFNLTPRITPLMIAVGYKNEPGVKFLLEAAAPKSILKEYVNLSSGTEGGGEAWESEYNQKSKFLFTCDEESAALHCTAYQKNSVPASIVKELLMSGADPNVYNTYARSPLAETIWSFDVKTSGDSKQKIALLIEHGADPKLGEGVFITSRAQDPYRLSTACDVLLRIIEDYEDAIEDKNSKEEPENIRYFRGLIIKFECS